MLDADLVPGGRLPGEADAAVVVLVAFVRGPGEIVLLDPRHGALVVVEPRHVLVRFPLTVRTVEPELVSANRTAGRRVEVVDVVDPIDRRQSLRLQVLREVPALHLVVGERDRKSTRLNSSHSQISYAVFC